MVTLHSSLAQEIYVQQALTPKITAGMLCEFKFQIFAELETKFAVFHSPFTVKSSDVLVEIQLQIIDLQCEADLKDKFASVGLDTFHQCVSYQGTLN